MARASAVNPIGAAVTSDLVNLHYAASKGAPTFVAPTRALGNLVRTDVTRPVASSDEPLVVAAYP